MNRPSWLTTDWNKAYFAAERALSPRLERLVGTDAFLDALAAATGLTAAARRTVSSVGNGIVETLGLPSSRQLRSLQRSAIEAIGAIEAIDSHRDES